MSTVELFVGLKIPDTTAITTFHVLERLGYKIKKVTRNIYYKFEIEDGAERFSEKIGKIDVLVNVNKNKFSTKLEKEEGAYYILVKDIDDKCESLLQTLHKLGLHEIKSIEKGVLWILFVDTEKIAEEIAERLLYNKNYQECEIF
jgi:phosphoribosylformylglycinamidine (FGAM) synthase PurS component